MSKTKFISSLVVIAALACAALASAAGPSVTAAKQPVRAKDHKTAVDDVERGPLDAIASSSEAHKTDSRKQIADIVEAKKVPAKPKPAPVPSGPVAGVSQSTLDAIAACESGGDPTAVNAGGYYGKYQFDLGTWASVGGTGNPADASEGEQDYRASLLYSRAGSSPWPVCGQ